MAHQTGLSVGRVEGFGPKPVGQRVGPKPVGQRVQVVMSARVACALLELRTMTVTFSGECR